jgi:hypothetical protein
MVMDARAAEDVLLFFSMHERSMAAICKAFIYLLKNKSYFKKWTSGRHN